MALIRPFARGDTNDLYRIALATGDSGGDAAPLHDDPRLVGDVYAAPYAALSPATAFVAEDREGVAGYIVGAIDTRAFEESLERQWWPRLRARHPDPSAVAHDAWTPDQRLAWLIHHPWPARADLIARFPSHLHINLLPRLQGRGMGRRLMDHWLTLARSMGSPGVHLGVSAANARAIAFYRARGLETPALAKPPPRGVIWFVNPFQPIGSGPHQPGR
ncbi:MAG: GNAT family N-acetyltransferase [Caulobacteraceae bacterium]